MIPEPITLDGRTGTVVYLDAQWHPTTSEQATMARVLFDDGGTGFYLTEPVSSVAPGVGGITRKFDEALHPRDPDGRFAEATTPRIFNRPSDVEQSHSGWANDPMRWAWLDKETGKPGGHLLTGVPILREEIPATLYHVTTNAPAVESSGVLLGQQGDTGLGGGQAAGVSFTSSPEDAAVIQRELRRSVRVARGEVAIEDLSTWAREDERLAGLPEGTLQPAVGFATDQYEANRHSLERTFVWDKDLPEDQRGWVGPPPPPEEQERLRRSSVKDALNAYLQMRGHHDVTHPMLKNPILFGRQEHLAKLNPEHIQTLEIPSSQIPAEALVTTGSDAFLHEVRVYADVPLRRRKVAFEESQHPREGKGTAEGGQFTEAGRSGAQSTPVLAAQAQAGIAAVETLLPEAIKTADFESTTPQTWDEVESDTQGEVYQRWREGAEQEIDTSEELREGARQALEEENQDVIDKATYAMIEEVKAHLGKTINDLTVQPTGYGGTVELDNPDDVQFMDDSKPTPEEVTSIKESFARQYEIAFESILSDRLDSGHWDTEEAAIMERRLEDEWESLNDHTKMALMRGYGISQPFEGGHAPTTWVTGVVTGQASDEDYTRTGIIARQLTMLRMDQVRKERGLLEPPTPPIFTVEAGSGSGDTSLAGSGYGDKYLIKNASGKVIGGSNTEAQAKLNAVAWAERSVGRIPSSADVILSVWQAWKQKSSEGLGASLQLAAARELGGHHRMTPEEVVEAERVAADHGGMETLQAYVRAQWEVTQFVMAKANEATLPVYRGLMLPDEAVKRTSQVLVDKMGDPIPPPSNIEVVKNWEGFSTNHIRFTFNNEQFVVEKQRVPATDIREVGHTELESDEAAIQRRLDKYLTDVYKPSAAFTKLPEILLQRAGAQSTTGTRSVANDWGGVGDLPEHPVRVVLRIEAPATSVLSLPVYGENTQGEHESVLVGTTDRWAWDAWRDRAPDFASQAISGMTRKSEPLVIDLQAEDRGKPHWMSGVDWSTVVKWDEQQHPRATDGRFTDTTGATAPPPDPGAGGSGGVGVPTPAAQKRPAPNAAAQAVANAYTAQHGMPPVEHGYVPVDEARAGRIADAYEALPTIATDPETQEAYAALGREVQAQWDHIVASGVTFEPWTQEGQPYQSSVEMAEDVRQHQHLFFFTGGEPHPYLGAIDPTSGLSLNDKLRAVHDYFGHAAGGYGFGARGEENAWIAHSQMFTPEARRAMTSETRGQNSWVNFGRHNYNPDGSYKHIPAAERPYAVQKTALLPDEFVQLRAGESTL